MDSIYPGSIWSTARPEDVGMDSGEREFYTLPESPEAYGFLALGDVHSLPDVWHKVSQRIYENESDALFIVGSGDDSADGSQYDQWIDQFFSPARDLLGRVTFWPAIGNHERTRQFVTVPPTAEQAERSHYFSLFELPGNEHWYRVDDQYLTLLTIDSNSQLVPGFEQYDWLHEQLRSSRNRYTVAYVVTGGGALYQINSAENRYQQVAKSTNHYLVSDMTTAKMDVTAMDAEGEIIDQFVVPVGRATRGRMNSGWSQQLMGSIEFSREGEQSKGVLTNPLDFDVDLSLAGEGADKSDVRVPSGGMDGVAIDVIPSQEDLSQPAWRGAISLAYDGDPAWRRRWNSSGRHDAGSGRVTRDILPCVEDEDVANSPGASPWGVDGVEIYIDGRGESARTASYDALVSQNVLPALRPDDAVEGTNAWGKGLLWAASRYDGGYTLEMTIPCAQIRGDAQARPTVGDIVRFDEMINDLDGGRVSHHRLWSTGGASRDPSGFGQPLLVE